MRKHTWKTKQNENTDSVEFSADVPTTMDDMGLIKLLFGTVKRMIDRAVAQRTVDVAVGIRKRLPNVESAQKYAETWCDDGTKDAYVQPSINAQKAMDEYDFTEEQLRWIAEQGMAVNMDEDSDVVTGFDSSPPPDDVNSRPGPDDDN